MFFRDAVNYFCYISNSFCLNRYASRVHSWARKFNGVTFFLKLESLLRYAINELEGFYISLMILFVDKMFIFWNLKVLASRKTFCGFLKEGWPPSFKIHNLLACHWLHMKRWLPFLGILNYLIILERKIYPDMATKNSFYDCKMAITWQKAVTPDGEVLVNHCESLSHG